MGQAPKAVLLDIDGTLIDSNEAHARAWADALREAGMAVHVDDVRARIGKGGDKVLPELTGVDAESAEGKAISARRGEIFKERYLPTLRAFPGARALLERMRASGLKLVVATSAREEELAPLLHVANVEDLVEERTSSSDAKRSKPDPDILQVALTRVEAAPEEAIMLGDTPYDVESARRAGVRSVGVRSGGWSESDLRGAIAVYDDVADLLRRFEDSPFSHIG